MDRKVGLIICDCRGLLPQAQELLDCFSEIPGLVVPELCATPQIAADFIQREELDFLLFAGCCDDETIASFRDWLCRRGKDPLALQTVPLVRGGLLPPGEEGRKKAKVLIAAGLARVRASPGSSPENVRFSYALPRKFSRRRILTLLRPHCIPVVALEEGRCVSYRGCRLCLDVCPTGALKEVENQVLLDKDKCTGCGRCLGICPVEALKFPGFSVEEFDAWFKALLARKSSEPRFILFFCHGSKEVLEALEEKDAIDLGPFFPFFIPCQGLLSPFLLLRPLELGAEGVGILPCKRNCPFGLELWKLEADLGWLSQLASHLGWPGRLVKIPEEDPEAVASRLKQWRLEVRELSFLIKAHDLLPEPPRLAGMIGRALDKGRCQHFSLKHPRLPMGWIDIAENKCSACGLCVHTCPTEALAQEGGIVFQPYKCIACGYCARICPEKAVKVRRLLDTRDMFSPHIVLRDEMLVCHRCKRPFTSARTARKLREKLTQAGMSPSALSYLEEICPDCRFKLNSTDIPADDTLSSG